MNIHQVVLASLLATSAFASLAQGVFQHPAVQTPAPVAGVNPSTFIVGHPASPSWQVRHANTDHPAVAMHQEASRTVIDPNTFLVQPPAHVQWTLRRDTAMEGAVAAARVN